LVGFDFSRLYIFCLFVSLSRLSVFCVIVSS